MTLLLFAPRSSVLLLSDFGWSFVRWTPGMCGDWMAVMEMAG